MYKLGTTKRLLVLILICLAKRKDKIPICKLNNLRIGMNTWAEFLLISSKCGSLLVITIALHQTQDRIF